MIRYFLAKLSDSGAVEIYAGPLHGYVSQSDIHLRRLQVHYYDENELEVCKREACEHDAEVMVIAPLSMISRLPD